MPTFRLNETVRIKAGPFAAFTGRIDGINQSRMMLKVRVSIHGRGYPVKLKFSEVEKIELILERPTTKDS